MTTADAARLLAISVRQVQRLAEAGQIAIRGTVGRAMLLDSASVHRLATVGTSRGRAWKADTAWMAMALLDGRLSTDLTSAARTKLSRLRDRLRHMPVEELVRMTRQRAEITHWRVSDSYARELHKRVLVTGESALDSRAGGTALAQLLQLGTRSPNGHIDGYVPAGQLSVLQHEFFLVQAGDGNITLRLTEGIPALADRRHSFRAALPVVALDLAESVDVRERAAGLRALTALTERL
ncbi:MAG: hypothetical protein QOE53_1057 [Pseudonocardiales bacterium]|nr:hypothetical protein [Pseudonocardiales bacterium]